MTRSSDSGDQPGVPVDPGATVDPDVPVELVTIAAPAAVLDADQPEASDFNQGALAQASRTARDTVARSLAAHRVACTDWTPDAASKEKLQDRFDEWTHRHTGGSIVYWTGHGEVDGGLRTTAKLRGYSMVVGEAPRLAIVFPNSGEIRTETKTTVRAPTMMDKHGISFGIPRAGQGK